MSGSLHSPYGMPSTNSPSADTEGIGLAGSTASVPSTGVHDSGQRSSAPSSTLLVPAAEAAEFGDTPPLPLQPHTLPDARPPHEHRPAQHTTPSATAPSPPSLPARPTSFASGNEYGVRGDVAVPSAAAAPPVHRGSSSAVPALHFEGAAEMTDAPRRDSGLPLQPSASAATVPPPSSGDHGEDVNSGCSSGSTSAPAGAGDDRDARAPTRKHDDGEDEEEEVLSSAFSRATAAPVGTPARRSVGFIIPHDDDAYVQSPQCSTDLSRSGAGHEASASGFSDTPASVLNVSRSTAAPPSQAGQSPQSIGTAAEGAYSSVLFSATPPVTGPISPTMRDAVALSAPPLRQRKNYFQGLSIQRPLHPSDELADHGSPMAATTAAAKPAEDESDRDADVSPLQIRLMDGAPTRHVHTESGGGGTALLTPLYERAKQALLTPGPRLPTPQLRRAHSRGNSDVAAAGTSSVPPLSARDRLSSWVTPLLRTPRLRRQPSGDTNSPLVVDRSVLEEPPRSPATFDARLREIKEAETSLSTHMVWQARGSDGRAFLSPRFLLVPLHDYVCIHWYDSTEEVFETDHTYLRVVPGGRHSCYNTNLIEEGEAPDQGLGDRGDAAQRRASASASHMAASFLFIPLPLGEAPAQQTADHTKEKNDEEHVLVNDATDVQLRLSAHASPLHRRMLTAGSPRSDPAHFRGLSDSSAAVTPRMRNSNYRAVRAASEVVLPAAPEDGMDDGAAADDARLHDRAAIAAAGSTYPTPASRQPLTPGGFGQLGRTSRQSSSFWMLQRAETRVALGDNCHTFTVQFSRPGDYYFVLSRHKRTMRLHVQVYTQKSLIAWRSILALVAACLAVALIVVVVLVLAYWMHHSTYIFGEDSAASYMQYLAFLDIHEVITLRLFPWLAVGVLILLFVLLAGIGWSVYRCFFPARAGAFTRGVYPRHRRIIGLCTAGLTFGIVVLMFVAFGLELNVADGVDNFAQAVAGAIISNLNMFSTAALQVNWLVEEANTVLPNVTLPTDQIKSLTAQVSSLLATVQKWTVFIEDIAQGAFRVLPIVLFLAMQLGFFAAALTIGALVLRFRYAAVATTWMLAVSAGFFACVCGIQFSISTVFSKVYVSAVVLRDDPSNFGNSIGLANDSFVSQLFSMCTITLDDVQVVSEVVNKLLGEVNSNLDSSGQAAFAELFGFIEDMVPTTMEALANYTAYIELSLETLQNILDNDGAAVNSLLKENVVPILQVLVSVVQTLSGLVNCQVLRDVVAGAIPIFQDSVQRYNSAVFVFLLIIFGVSVLLFVSSIGSTQAVRHPRRSWCCLRTGRWFRFRYSYKVHLATLMQGSKDVKHEQTILQWLVHHTTPFMYQLHSVKLVCYSSSTLMFFNSILMVLFNEVSRSTKKSKLIQALSYLGCAQLFFLLFASLFRRAWIRWLLHATALLCAAACLGVAVAQAIVGYVYFGECLEHKRYDMTGLQYGGLVDMTCSARYTGFNLETAVHATVWFLNGITLVATTAMLVRHERHLRASFVFRPYAGVLRRCEAFAPWLRHVFADQMYVKRIYTGLMIAVIVIFLICFAALDIGQWSVIRNVADPTLTDSDIVQVINPTKGCNGDAAYCKLRANQIIWACAHNAHSSLEDGFVLPNHYYNISHQLYAGIRSFMIDVWYDVVDANVSDAVDVYVCHTVCVAGRRTYRAIAQEFKSFLDAYPDQVIMIILEQYVNSSDLGRISDEVGLTQYVWYSTQTAPNYNPDYVWPTLQELIDTNQRAMMYNDVVAVAAESENCPEWLYYSFDFQYENFYTTVNTSVWECDIHRGWCTDLSTVQLPNKKKTGCEVRCGDGSASSSSSCSTRCPSSDSDSDSSSSSSSFDNTSLVLQDVTNCTMFGAHPSYVNGSDGYNDAFRTNPPNVRSKMSTMNHFITTGTGSPVSASQANQPTSIQTMTWNCSQRWNALVNILAFDYWTIATPLATIEAMNQNIAKYGQQYNFEDAWSQMLFGTSTPTV